MVGAIGIVGPLYRSSFIEATPLGVVAPYLASLILAVGGAVLVCRAIMNSYVNRALLTIIIGIMVGDLSLSMMALRYDLGSLWLFQTLPVVWAAGAMIAVGTISRRFWPTALAMTLLCGAGSAAMGERSDVHDERAPLPQRCLGQSKLVGTAETLRAAITHRRFVATHLDRVRT